MALTFAFILGTCVGFAAACFCRVAKIAGLESELAEANYALVVTREGEAALAESEAFLREGR